MVDWSDSPIGNWLFDDPELQALQNAMQRGAQYTQDYRKSAAQARAKGTANRLRAFEPANRTLTKLMGGEEQFDLGSFEDPMTTTPGMFAQGQRQAWTPMTDEEAVQEAGNIVGRLGAPGGRQSQEKAMNDQRTVWSAILGMPFLASRATANTDIVPRDSNLYANSAGFQQGETGPPPWWEPESMGAWVGPGGVSYSTTEEVREYEAGGRRNLVPQYRASWNKLTPEEQRQVIKEGRESEYQWYDPENPGHVLMAEPQFKGRLSDEELERLLGGE